MAILAGAVSEMALWTPADITTALWLDAADSSTLFDAVSGGSTPAADGAVARWEDKSGNNNHATQSDSTRRPIRKTAIQNSLDILRFDGSNDFFVGASTPCSSNDKTIIAMVKTSNGTGGNLFQNRVGGGPGSNLAFLCRLFRTTSNAIGGDTNTTNVTIGTDLSTAWQSFGLSSWTQQSSNRAVFYWHNGTNYTTSGIPLSETANAGYHVGCIRSGNTFFQFFPGDFSELVVLDLQADTDTRQKIEGYLAHKWGTTASLPNDHPYKNAAPTIGSIQVRRRRSRSGGGVL